MLQSNLEQGNHSTETTGGRRPEGVSVESGSAVGGHPSNEVPAKKGKRRKLTVAYKIRVIETVKSLKSEGGTSIGSYLRKEGLYYSTIRKWQEKYELGGLSGSQNKVKGKNTSALHLEIKKLRRQLESTEKKLKKTELIVDIQKKISLLLGIDQSSSDEEIYNLKLSNTRRKSG
jgi:transposase-like protein